MTGVGEASKFRLGPVWAIAAFELLCDHLDGQPDPSARGVTAAQFASDFCRPLKAGETWCKQQMSNFKKVAESSGSFQCLVCSWRIGVVT